MPSTSNSAVNKIGLASVAILANYDGPVRGIKIKKAHGSPVPVNTIAHVFGAPPAMTNLRPRVPATMGCLEGASPRTGKTRMERKGVVHPGWKPVFIPRTMLSPTHPSTVQPRNCVMFQPSPTGWGPTRYPATWSPGLPDTSSQPNYATLLLPSSKSVAAANNEPISFEKASKQMFTFPGVYNPECLMVYVEDEENKFIMSYAEAQKSVGVMSRDGTVFGMQRRYAYQWYGKHALFVSMEKYCEFQRKFSARQPEAKDTLRWVRENGDVVIKEEGQVEAFVGCSRR